MSSKLRLLRFPLVATIALLTFFFTSSPTAEAQRDSLVWDAPQTIKRVAKNRPRRRGRRDIERKPLLGLKLQLYRVKPDGSNVETNYNTPFRAGERLRLGVTANQEGFLYIINRQGTEQGGRVLFPDSQIDYGRNFVEKNQPFIVPSQCPDVAEEKDCAYTVPPSGAAEFFTLVFTRDNIDLPTAGRMVEGKQLKELIAQSNQNLGAPTGGIKGSPYAILIINRNRRDNEEIIKDFELGKAK